MEENQNTKKAYKSIWRNAEFTLSQVLMVFATIGGIYLAAQEGFRKAIEFDYYVKGDIDGYNLRASIRAELIGNLSGLHDMIRGVRETGYMPNTAADYPRIRTHVWEASKFHPALFEVPAPALASLGDFYDDLPALIARVKENTIKPQDFMDKIKAHMRRMEAKTLPQIETALDATRYSLGSYGAPLPDIIPPVGWSHAVPIDIGE